MPHQYKVPQKEENLPRPFLMFIPKKTLDIRAAIP